MNVALTFFVIFLIGTFGLAVVAARRAAGKASEFYAAGHNIGGLQNGLALAGDFVSAAAFLGVTGVVYAAGFEGLLLPIGVLTGWPLMLMIFADRMRNLGRYTFVDVLAYRLQGKGIRIAAAISALCINIMYAIAQLVGAGKLISLLLGVGYVPSLIVITGFMALYVVMGGMLVTTWIQVLKASLLLLGSVVLSVLIMARFGFSPNTLFAAAVDIHAKGEAILRPGLSYFADPLSGVSLSLALVFGSMGMPHVLMRFFTAPTAKEARGAVYWSTLFMSAFYILLIIIGYGAIALVLADPAVQALGGMPAGGTNMVVMHLTRLAGGEAFFGFMAAVGFATILAVVSGLAISGAATLSHDLARVLAPRLVASEKDEILLSRIGAVAVSVVALLFSILFENQNIAFLGALALGTSAAANVPVLFMALYWRGLTPRGATWGILTGLLLSFVLIAIGPVVMVDALKMKHAIINLANPTLVAMLGTTLVAWVLSVTDRSASADAARAGFAAQELASERA
jgi:cation/acetate symporter